MAMLKTLRKNYGGCKNIFIYLGKTKTKAQGTYEIQNYLEKGERSLAKDTFNVIDTEDWWQEFDKSRVAMGKNKGTKYFHMMIAPDPEDNADLETVRDLATRFMTDRYPNAQWVIEYHDDGANGNIHAHIVMNSVDIFSKKKIHLTDDDLREDTRYVQQLSKERGLTYFADENGNPTFNQNRGHKQRDTTAPPHPVADTRGKKWNDEVRHAVDEAIAHSSTFGGFIVYLQSLGFDAYRNSRGGITYVHPHTFRNTDRHYKVRGTIDNLGKDYTIEAIYKRLPLGYEHPCYGAAPRPATKMHWLGDIKLEDSLAHYSAAEKRLIDRGGHSWKQDIRDAVDEEIEKCLTFDAFVKALHDCHGIEVEITKRGGLEYITYVHPDVRENGKHYKVRGTTDNLGCGYTYTGVWSRIGAAHSEHPAGLVRGYLSPYVPPAKNLAEMMERRAKRRPWINADRVVEAVNVVSNKGYESLKAMKDDTNELAKDVAELEAQLQYAEARVEKIEEAAAKAKRLYDIEQYQEGKPRLPDNLFDEREEIVEWLVANNFKMDDKGLSASVMAARERENIEGLQTRLDILTQNLSVMERSLNTMADLSFYTVDDDYIDRAEREARARIANDLSQNFTKRYSKVVKLHTSFFSSEVEELKNKQFTILNNEAIAKARASKDAAERQEKIMQNTVPIEGEAEKVEQPQPQPQVQQAPQPPAPSQTPHIRR